MGNLHGHRRAGDHHDLMAPVELVSFARRKTQRHIRIPCTGRLLTMPAVRIAPDRIIAALISGGAQRLEYPDKGQAFARRLCCIGRQQPLKLILPGAQLGKRLGFTLVMKFRLARTQDLADNLARKFQVPADRLDRFSLNEVRAADFGDRLHDQHPSFGSRFFSRALCEPLRQGGPFWTPITPKAGPLLHADPHDQQPKLSIKPTINAFDDMSSMMSAAAFIDVNPS